MSAFRRLHRHLDPVDTLGELIFGLIMVLTFTLGARLLGQDGPGDARELLAAAIGCNLAWGIIDGFLYVLGRTYERRRIAIVAKRVRESTGTESAMAILEDAMDSELTAAADPSERRRFCNAIAAGLRRLPPPATRVTAADVRGAILVFCLVLATSVPAAAPFLLIENAYLALRLSNALLIALLFAVGFFWGRHVGVTPWLAGMLVMSIGVLLVLIAIPLGG